ncbi:MAG: hypothetical protein ACOC5T_06180 [Elusimicrobiota bacterium]
MEGIKYCPVCGSKNIRKQPLIPTSSENAKQESVDYYCEDCESNGDMDIIIKNNQTTIKKNHKGKQ